ncbi:AP2-like ethylene-responsive transcription factor ANT isoform X1 [Populus nigra]|uniref:AP2-like ethylene-responsive transcription factor ANT isoform X1 n=1 Tax=Populus nigra TaxID=3691 RepID=UPI002B27A1B2|nr:AP2-like ethylene-responsive transcription factor ANT isoform X1 [Populus nigra]
MKSMNNDDGSNNHNADWLGFSLSPQMNMEVPSGTDHHQQTRSASVAVPTAIPTNLFHSQLPHLNCGLYYGVEGENGGFYSPLHVMSLKADGSPCMMDALTRTQPQATMVTTSTPKLEDFFVGATMGTHHYESNDREAMALSLDSSTTMFYHQDTDHEPNNQICLNHLEQNPRQQHHHHIQVQQYPYYSNFRNNEMSVGEDAKQMTQASDCNLLLPNMGDDGITGMKNWVSRNHQSNHVMEQKMLRCVVENGGESGPNISAMTYGDLQCLSLSMSPGSQSSCVTGTSQQISPSVTDCAAVETKKRGPGKGDQKQIVHRKSIDTFGQRTSQYRGVTRHRWTGRYEAHLWDNSCKKEGQSRKGRQVYLGGYDMEEKAARAYDLAALKYWGPSTHINSPLENYQKEIEEMKSMTRQEYVAHLRRKSSGFSRGASIYRGVTSRHHQHGRWQARIGRVAGNKDLYLGTFSTQEEAAEAYDVAAIKFRGVSAVTNFDITRYDVERIMASNTLLAGELARRNKDIGPCNDATTNHNPSTHKSENESDWKMVICQSSQQLDHKASNAVDNYKTQAFSLSPENVIANDSIFSLHQQQVEDSSKMGTHMSNASSLVTSLCSSREGSPDRANLPVLFGMPPSAASKLYASPICDVNSWIPAAAAAQLRPAAVSLPHMPVFAAWTDA